MAKPAIPPPRDKPLPDAARPDTAGTQMLMSNRRAASSAFQKAHRAEQAHIAHKQAVAARTGLQEAKVHFTTSGKEFWSGLKKLGGGFKAIPAVLKEKRLETLRKKDKRNMARALEKKKLWDERAARAQAEAEKEAEGG